jgi:UDPglucose 6-dehydrogenase
VALSAEASWNPRYGIRGGSPFAGSCLPKDTEAFYDFATRLGVEMPVLSGTIRTNRIMEHRASQMEVLTTAPAPRSHVQGAGRAVWDLGIAAHATRAHAGRDRSP